MYVVCLNEIIQHNNTHVIRIRHVFMFRINASMVPHVTPKMLMRCAFALDILKDLLVPKTSTNVLTITIVQKKRHA